MPTSAARSMGARFMVSRNATGNASSSHSRTRAQSIHRAYLAFRPPRDAHAAPVDDQGVRAPGPLVARHDRHQVALDLHGICLFCEAEERCEPLDVGIPHPSFLLPDACAEDHVRALSTHAREL